MKTLHWILVFVYKPNEYSYNMWELLKIRNCIFIDKMIKIESEINIS